MTKLEHLKALHLHTHKLVEAAEGENAPEEFIKSLKKKKLKLKDEIQRVDKNYKLNYNG
jgi:uncharacterized protein YdcH (DUF465 family)